ARPEAERLVLRRRVDGQKEERRRPRITYVMKRASGDRDDGSVTHLVFGAADAEQSLTLDDVHDLIAAMLLLRPAVGTGRDGHHDHLAVRRLLQHAEEGPTVRGQRRDLRVLVSFHRLSTPFWTRMTPSQRSWPATKTASAGSRPLRTYVRYC